MTWTWIFVIISGWKGVKGRIARNGHFIQLIRLKRIEGNWVMATKILRGKTKLRERIDSEFPGNKGVKLIGTDVINYNILF